MPNVQYDDAFEKSFNDQAFKRSIRQGLYDLQMGKVSKGSLPSNDGHSRGSLDE